jgi:hypothetical protein
MTGSGHSFILLSSFFDIFLFLVFIIGYHIYVVMRFLLEENLVLLYKMMFIVVINHIRMNMNLNKQLLIEHLQK